MKMLMVGLTGGIVSGKSTVSEMFRQLGAQVIDADQIAHTIVSPGEKAWHSIVEYFGKEILIKNQQINRKKLAKIVFADKKKLEMLNSITHPEILAVINRRICQLKSNYNQDLICIIDAPLLFEANLAGRMDKIIVVFISQEEQTKRLLLRDNFTEEEALRRIQSQIPLTSKLSWADYVIDNSFSREQTKKQVEQVWEKLKNELVKK